MQRSLRNTIACGVAGVLALFACAGVNAQTFPDWVNPCGTPFGSDYVSAKTRLVGATVFLAPVAQLVASGTPGYRRFSAQPAGGFTAVAGHPVVPGSPFYGEKRMSANGRTGYLVAPDIIVTAAHVGFNMDGYAVVFDMRARGSGCPLPDFDLIPEANIAWPPHTLLANPIGDFPPGTYDNRYDYAAFRIQQPRTDRQFIRMRRSGEPESADAYMLASHPERMSLKVSRFVEFAGFDVLPPPLPSQQPSQVPRFLNYAMMDGSSGGPMFNLSRQFVESSFGSPNGPNAPVPTFGCLKLLPAGGGLSQMTNDCDIIPNQQSLNGGSIKTFAAALPAAELLVSPLGTVTQRLPLGGTPAQTNFQYELRVHAQAPAAVSYDASVAAPASGQPALLTMTPSSGTLPIGGSVVKNVTLSAAGITTCGTYEQTLSFADVGRFNDSVTHRLEVGLTDYALDKPASAVFQGVVSPYQPAQFQYTLRNTRPSPTQIKVSHNTAWLRVDGQALPAGVGHVREVLHARRAGLAGRYGHRDRHARHRERQCAADKPARRGPLVPEPRRLPGRQLGRDQHARRVAGQAQLDV